DRGENCDPRRAKAGLCPEIDCVLNDIALGIKIGEDIDCSIRDEQRVWICRYVEDEDVADTTCSAQPGFRVGHRAHQFVGGQTALHQDFTHSRLNEFDGFFCCCIAVRGVDNFDPVQIQFVRAGDRRNLCCWSDQDGNDKPCCCGLKGAAQRSLIAWMHHKCLWRIDALRSSDQTLIFCMRL